MADDEQLHQQRGAAEEADICPDRPLISQLRLLRKMPMGTASMRPSIEEAATSQMVV